jgi:hypothetical protein
MWNVIGLFTGMGKYDVRDCASLSARLPDAVFKAESPHFHFLPFFFFFFISFSAFE